MTRQRVNGFEVDFFWPTLGLVVETDGLRYHRTPAQQARDRVRDQAHTAAGLTPLRFTARAGALRAGLRPRDPASRWPRRLQARGAGGSKRGPGHKLPVDVSLPSSVRIREVGPARRLPERAGDDRDRRQGAADRPALGDRAAADRGDLVRAARRDPAARRRRGGAGRGRAARRGLLLGPDPERARPRAGAGDARPLRRDQRLPLRLGDPQPQERQPLDRGVAGRAGGDAGDRDARRACAARA